MKNDCRPMAATARLLRSARRQTVGLSSALRVLAGFFVVASLLTGVAHSAQAAETFDLSTAVVVVPKGLAGPEAQAVRMLVEEVEKRSQLRWPVMDTWPEKAGAVILVGPSRFANDVMDQHQLPESPRFDAPEGYRLRVVDAKPPIVMVAGNDSRGVLFGVGRLLRPRTDDAADSPHFPLPQMQMMVEMSRLLDQYGLDVWIWYPAMDADYSKPETVEKALDAWANVFTQLPRIDAVFVPGGDPGHTDPAVLLPFLEKQTANLHRFHPKAQMWVSPQSFNQEWLDRFISYVNDKQPTWLSGVVYGPQIRISLPKLRAAIPKKYPIRRYPDITHR